jgi:hypothetical protein
MSDPGSNVNETASADKLCCDCHFWQGSCRFKINATARSEICEKFLPRFGNEYRTNEGVDYSVFGGKAKFLQLEILKTVDELEKVKTCLKGEKEEPHE